MGSELTMLMMLSLCSNDVVIVQQRDLSWLRWWCCHCAAMGSELTMLMMLSLCSNGIWWRWLRIIPSFLFTTYVKVRSLCNRFRCLFSWTFAAVKHLLYSQHLN